MPMAHYCKWKSNQHSWSQKSNLVHLRADIKGMTLLANKTVPQLRYL